VTLFFELNGEQRLTEWLTEFSLTSGGKFSINNLIVTLDRPAESTSNALECGLR
jgi:hypothetical protein